MDVLEFVKVKSSVHGYGCGGGYGDGYGDGNGFGDGYGYGYGDGCGHGDGKGNGNGNGNSYGNGSGGNGDGNGFGDGKGNGNGFGFGDGNGDGYGYGGGIKGFNGKVVHEIDGLETIITAVHKGIAKGFILQADMTLKPCYIAKGNNMFAHGNTINEAVISLRNKVFANLDVDERVAEFKKAFSPNRKYPNRDFYEWHGRLTGSCEMGRRQFAESHNIDIEHGRMTVKEFCNLTENSYGGEIVKMIAEPYKETGK